MSMGSTVPPGKHGVSLFERQLTDVENLIASGCDMAYLQTWSAALNLTDMLTRVLP